MLLLPIIVDLSNVRYPRLTKGLLIALVVCGVILLVLQIVGLVLGVPIK